MSHITEKIQTLNRLEREIHNSLNEAKETFEKDYEGIDIILDNPERRLSYYLGWMKHKNIETKAEINNLIELIIKEYNNE